MQKADILKAAIDCGLSPKIASFFADTLYHAMEFARAEEREECAKVAALWDLGTPDGHSIAEAIRARGK